MKPYSKHNPGQLPAFLSFHNDQGNMETIPLLLLGSTLYKLNPTVVGRIRRIFKTALDLHFQNFIVLFLPDWHLCNSKLQFFRTSVEMTPQKKLNLRFINSYTFARTWTLHTYGVSFNSLKKYVWSREKKSLLPHSNNQTNQRILCFPLRSHSHKNF